MSLLPWLEPSFAHFMGIVHRQKIAHAQLVGGSIGYGADTLCMAMAQAVLCEKASNHGACGFCKSCQLFEAKTHPDFYALEADGNQIKVDQVRQLCQRLQSTAQQGGYRVALIRQCEKLNHAAANALLKTLEEPGVNSLLILQSDTPSRLMATITSRCQRTLVATPDKKVLRAWLEQQLGPCQDKLWCLPVVGGPIPLVEYCENGHYEQLLKYRNNWVNSLTTGQLQLGFTQLKDEHLVDALKVLYFVLRQQLLQPKLDNPFVRQAVVALADQVMHQVHQLNRMPNVNNLAICQRFVLEYQQVTKL